MSAIRFRIQTKLLDKSMMICKVGGKIVYSTCSMNPVEDEAVVLACLLRAEGAGPHLNVSCAAGASCPVPSSHGLGGGGLPSSAGCFKALGWTVHGLALPFVSMCASAHVAASAMAVASPRAGTNSQCVAPGNVPGSAVCGVRGAL